MEDILAVYQRPRDAVFPLVCLDETSKQLSRETRDLIPMKKGHAQRVDYEYERNGVANLFMCSRRSRAGDTSRSPIATRRPITPTATRTDKCFSAFSCPIAFERGPWERAQR